MAIFCTQCGAKNDDGAAFCDGCGASLRKPAALVTPALPVADPVKGKPFVLSKKVLYVGAAAGGLLLLGGVGLYLALTPPTATSSTLLTAAKAGYDKTLSVQYKNELCLSNMNYGAANINVGEYDKGTQTWLNTLVTAGLFSPPVMVNSGGYFSQNLLQYVATPELSKWRDGARLCVAKGIDMADVIDIEKPQEEPLGRQANGSDSKLLMVKAKLVLQATEVAPWLEKEEVRAAALEKMRGWDYKNAKLQRQIPDIFGLREGKWTTGPAYKAELQKQNWASQRAYEGGRTVGQQTSAPGLAAMFSRLFSFGGHPMMGTWRKVANGLGQDEAQMIFTSDTCHIQNLLAKCKFEVDGNQVTITPEDQSGRLVFILQDKTTATLNLGFAKANFKRVD